MIRSSGSSGVHLWDEADAALLVPERLIVETQRQVGPVAIALWVSLRYLALRETPVTDPVRRLAELTGLAEAEVRRGLDTLEAAGLLDPGASPPPAPQDELSKTTREYIITADRDEHIRVSRGIPQAHVIEGYCLGHEEFVSRLCVAPGGREDILISGGGDDYLLVWDWPRCRLLGKAGVLEHVRGVEGQEEANKVAVTRVFACRWADGVSVFVIVER